MIDRTTEQPFCQTHSVSGSTFAADCFDVSYFCEDGNQLMLYVALWCCAWDIIIPFEKLWKEYDRV